jgi:hypothetical protein
MVRILDKIGRIRQLYQAGLHGEVKEESISDTALDLIGYAAILAYVLDKKLIGKDD